MVRSEQRLFLKPLILLSATHGCSPYHTQVTSLDSDDQMKYRSINACLKPLFSMHGLSVTTTEGIGNKLDGYHPVQERVAACNGAQCGFCTPGHVMAMYSLLCEKGTKTLSGKEIESRFDGNICRCTGYRAIMTAMSTFETEDGSTPRNIEQAITLFFRS